MSVKVTATITCDTCRVSITVKGGAGTNASEAREIAKRHYGWTTGTKSDRCLDHRVRPLRFHAFQKDEETGWSRCAVCGSIDWAAAQGGDPRQPQHRQTTVGINAGDLRRSGVGVWS